MKSWKWMLTCLVILSITLPAAAQGQRQGRPEMTDEEREERAKIAKEAVPLTAQAISDFLELKGAAVKKFKTAYAKEAATAQERIVEARKLEDRTKRSEAYLASSKKTLAALKKSLTEEQMKKAAPLLGGSRYSSNSLDRSIQSLLRAKVEKAKIKKALPVLVTYTVERSKIYGTTRGENMSAEDRDAARAKSDALRAKLTKDLTPIIGEEAAAAMQRSGMRGGTRRGAGGTGAVPRI